MEIISLYIEVHLFRQSEGKMEYLLLQRGETEIYPGLWQMVTGKIKRGEKAYETALREIKEETGLIPERLWAAPKVNQFYSAEKDAVYTVPVFAAQLKWGENITICREHCAHQWVVPQKAKEMLPWDEQRRALEIVVDYVMNMPDYLNMVEIHFKR